MAYLINGAGFVPVLAQDEADYYGGLSGGVTCILPFGNRMSNTLPDANTVRLADGVLVTREGRRIQIRSGEYEDFTIPTGSQGVTAYYIIGYHIYTDNRSAEVVEPFVRAMSSASATIAENQLRDGYTEVYVSLYRVRQNGVSINQVTRLVDIAKSMADVATLETSLATAAATAKNHTDAQHMHPGRTDVLTPQCIGFITNSKKTIDVMVPLKKTLGSDVSGISVYSLYATVRQTGPGYLYGAAGAPKAIDPKHCTVYDTRGGLRLVWTESKAINDKAINNGLISMDVQLRLTLT